ncbi:glycine betaine ABC transporter substrate-binding protein [Isachenkonia alkalipeptolytica]|uniref:Glycine betaine ABC transporter substrate-binding protein n=1 Tax=Isachenkonia alkalipeptolytica TaxID=2565777 RepID=A0AA44BDY9_9CLOT|nr:glycine betaine ABC transporter substrate-binding protein [Isachenkonia alkalipeptolytica]NBG88452.1 glycine betaine ABC transporter substrate-binding protein [Isachenkonia alkalipeptolytica]
MFTSYKSKKAILVFAVLLLSMIVLFACGDSEEEVDNGGKEAESNETIVFGMSNWSSTRVPTDIIRLILEEAGYETDETHADQPLIFMGLENENIDFFMDAWLPHTEEYLWEQYQESLIKVATSYEDVPLGWVVPTYVEADSIDDLVGNSDQYTDQIIGLSPGSGMTETSMQMMDDYDLEEYEYVSSSESAMMANAVRFIEREEAVIFLGWRPHSMFTQFDLKFLDGQDDYFKSDNVYVISYDGIQEKHPEVYDMLSRWSIDVEDLEEIMYQHEENEVPFDELAEEWVEDNRDKVDYILGNE